MFENTFEIFVALCAGIGLAAAAGIRAFLPLLALSIGARIGLVDLNSSMEFLATDIALIALVVATIVEIGSDKIPIVDNMLDVVSTFLRPAAGFIAAMAMFGELPQSVAVATALVMAVLSLGTQLGRAKARLGSTATTGGFANPLLSTAEDAVSGTLSVLALVVPILAGLGVILLLWVLWRLSRTLRRVRVQRSHARGRSRAKESDHVVLGDGDDWSPLQNDRSAPFPPTGRGGGAGDPNRRDRMEISPEP